MLGEATGVKQSRWQAAAAIVVALVLYERLPAKLTFGPIWVAPLLVLGLLLPLLVTGPKIQSHIRRVASVSLIAILNFFNLVSVVLLISDLVSGAKGGHAVAPLDLLRSGALIWLTNVIVFGLWFWEIDRETGFPDFLFPQATLREANPSMVPPSWEPMFADYLYLAFTNALAFSPTDVMPLSRLSKVLMLVESLISFATVALILARSVNILT